MKFRFKEIGPIEEAELALGDFTIIAGRNNTGKSYLVHTLYGFLKGARDLLWSPAGSQFFDSHFEKTVSLSTDDLVSKLIAEGQIAWDVGESARIEEQAGLLRAMTREFSENGIARVFSTPRDSFEGSALDVEYSREVRPNRRLSISIRQGRELSIVYDGTKLTVSLTEAEAVGESDIEPYYINRMFRYIYGYFSLQDFFALQHSSFIFSSARHTVPLFSNELDFARSQVVRLLQQREDGEDGESSHGFDPLRHTSRYALPIQDNIDFARRMTGRAERFDNRPQSAFTEDLARMMGGFFKSISGQVRFIASEDNRADFDIPLHLASSSAWEMSNLYFFLGYFLEGEGPHFLIIDEPESHLDTANQIRLARLLARLVNSGMKVLITTHSDYIIREVNNLILLDSFKEEKEFFGEIDFDYCESDHLAENRVMAYIAENGGLKECDKDEFGIRTPVFDETIERMNRVSTDLEAKLTMRNEGA